MQIDQLLASLTPDIIEKFKTAIEIGKWPDGKKLTDAQMQTCMQAIIAYEHEHVPESERTGFVPPKPDPCGDTDDVQDLNFTDKNN